MAQPRSDPPTRPPLSSLLPPLILGTATFNSQYVTDPLLMPSSQIVSRALSLGIRAFDTSPYYGPSESLLGQALAGADPPVPRDRYLLLTKVGRVGSSSFDYSPRWVRYSVLRSLERLRTDHLDVVYCHDVEFVPPEHVVEAVAELRSLRDDLGVVKYVGICGYPLDVLTSLADLVLQRTSEPLDIVQTFSHYILQNSRLGREACLSRFRAAGVPLVTNAGMLGMGLLTTRGIVSSPQAAWHPAPPELRDRCREMARLAQGEGQTLEKASIRWALRHWSREGAEFGSQVAAPGWKGDGRLGISVIGVSTVEELDETMALWDEVVRAVQEGQSPSDANDELVRGKLWPVLKRGGWLDYSWASPGPAYRNALERFGAVPDDEIYQRYKDTIDAAAAGPR